VSERSNDRAKRWALLTCVALGILLVAADVAALGGECNRQEQKQ